METIILTDTRERTGALPYLDSAVSQNNRICAKLLPSIGGGDIKHKIQQLTLGDYAIMLNNKLEAIFERKTWKDLAASIKDNRAQSQQKRLAELKYKHPSCMVCYIIEGPMVYNDQYPIGNIPFKNLHAKLRHNLIRGFPFIQTRDAQHTAHTLVNFARDFMKISVKNTPSVYMDELYALQSKYMIQMKDDKIFQNIMTTLEMPIIEMPIVENNVPAPTAYAKITERAIHTNDDILCAMWNTLSGIADKTSIVLMQKYHISTLLALRPERYISVKRELTSLVLTDGRILGEKKVSSILSLCYFGTEMIKKTLLHNQSQKILSCIPGITLESADAILKQYTLRQICEGLVSADMLAEVVLQNARQLGQKKAADILVVFVNSVC
jgi:ERCC4-type nuclease